MTIVVGDLHGKIDIARRALDLAQHTNEQVVFVGDYLDSFDLPTENHIDLLELLLDTRDCYNVITLMGNHELSYLVPSLRASGFRADIAEYIQSKPALLMEMHKKLEPFVSINGWLITHAGVSANWLPSYIGSNNLIEALGSSLERMHYDIGYARGGTASCGGIYWCDYYDEFVPVPGVKQIFGHTRARRFGDHQGIVNKGDNYNIDCLDYVDEVLRIKDDSTVEIVEL
jgi:hypothetical protein